MIKGKLTISAFKHAIVKMRNKAGEEVEGIFIPIKDNYLFKSEKGNVFCDIVAFELKTPFTNKDGEISADYSISQSFEKEERERRKASGEWVNLGTMLVNGLSGGNSEQTPNSDTFVFDGEGADLPY